MNDLLTELVERYGLEVVMAFADDLLIALSKKEDLLYLIETVEKWAQNNKIQLNKNKGKSAYIKLVPRSTKKDK